MKKKYLRCSRYRIEKDSEEEDIENEKEWRKNTEIKNPLSTSKSSLETISKILKEMKYNIIPNS